MSVIADGIDFVAGILSSSKSSKLEKPGVDHGGYLAASRMAYFAVSFVWLFVWHKVSQKDFSAIITAAAVVQCFGFVILSMRTRATKSVAGLSSKTLVLMVLCLCIRLCSTTLKRGYIPVDRSGHYFYQFVDMVTVALAAQLIYLAHKTYQNSYQEEYDTFPIIPVIVPCVVLACFVHGNFNRNMFFDIVWYTSLNLETVAMLPQLWMMSKIGGKVSAMSAQFVASNVISKVMTFTFWIWAYPELADEQGNNVAGKAIMLAYATQLLLSADFMFYYAKGLLEGTEETILPTDSLEI